jgi:formamidopyrimidine-DNA glycosylase
VPFARVRFQHNGSVPELPEVESLIAFLRQHAVGRTVSRVDVAAISALTTYDPPLSALHGHTVVAADRHGKFLDLSVGDEPLHLVIHLARAGWLQWRDPMSSVPPKMGRGPIAVRVHLSGAPTTDPTAEERSVGFDLTEAGTRKKLSVALVRDPADVPGVARLGVDPLTEEFTVERLAAILAAAGGKQLKGVLRDQSTIAGIGNAYSDEGLHAAKMSPFRGANKLDDAEVATLHAAIVETLRDALGRAMGLAAGELKSEKKSNMRVHGRTGLPCPECGDTVREVSFADSSLQYCPTCQTGGKPLADRRLSKLLK